MWPRSRRDPGWRSMRRRWKNFTSIPLFTFIPGCRGTIGGRGGRFGAGGGAVIIRGTVAAHGGGIAAIGTPSRCNNPGSTSSEEEGSAGFPYLADPVCVFPLWSAIRNRAIQSHIGLRLDGLKHCAHNPTRFRQTFCWFPASNRPVPASKCGYGNMRRGYLRQRSE